MKPVSLVVLLAAMGCGSAPPVPPRRVDAAACPAAPTEPLSVVGWSTDQLSRFQAASVRDVVFVRWEACALTVVDACRDEGVAGRFGAYQVMARLPLAEDRRTLQGAEDVRRVMPLAPADLVPPLDVDVITRGTREATRAAWSRGELAAIAGCARATHVVRAFDVGAFAIRSAAFSAHQGDLASCAMEGDATEACRVPVRVMLVAVTP